MHKIKYFVFVFASIMLTFSCSEEPKGLYPTQDGCGPVVKFDLEKKPFPDIPFPNDIATRFDPNSPTGKRLNFSTDVPLEEERKLRKKLNTLTGFGTYAPIFVSFDKPIDVMNIYHRHTRNPDGSFNDDFSDDAVYLVRIDKGEGYGKPVPIDFGRGHFPLPVQNPNRYFPNDPHNVCTNLVLETHNEDTNNNGQLDWGEDLDSDGVLDKPNLYPNGTDQDRDLLDFFEYQTNTLIIRPVVPLKERAKYAVVLTTRLSDADGNPVRSPFKYVNHISQTEDLLPLKDLMPKLTEGELGVEGIAFAWVFTTQDVTGTLQAIREGLQGRGVFKRLAEDFPPDIIKLLPATLTKEGVNRYLLPMDELVSLIVSTGLLGDYISDKFMESFKYVDYIVQGTFEAPDFMFDSDGIATDFYPANDDESFRVDPYTGELQYKRKTITFWCAIPKQHSGFKPPFPVVIYSHGYTSNRIEILGFAGNHARMGFATCGIDSFGHGVEIPPEFFEDPVNRSLLLGLMRGKGYEEFFWNFLKGQARDLNNDGFVDSGADFWVADIFHTRDSVRQTVVDHLQFIRVLLACDGKRYWRDGAIDNNMLLDGSHSEIACDFNGDGIADITGAVQPQVFASVPEFDANSNFMPTSNGQDIFVWGQSMGGIVSGVLAGVEPQLTAAAPTALGAGLVDVGLRSTIGRVVNAVFNPLIGPAVEAIPARDENESGRLLFCVGNLYTTKRIVFADDVPELEPGGKIQVVNLKTGEEFWGFLPLDGKGIRIPFAADALNAVEKRMLAGAPDPLPLREYVNRLEEAEANGETFVDPGRQTIELPADSEITRYGDPLVVVIYNRQGEIVRTVDTFEVDNFVFQNCHFPKGAPLIAPAAGLGKQRNSPDLRWLLAIAQMIVEGGDPVNYAPHYFAEPLPYPDADRNPVLIIPTAGDNLVPVATGIGAARAAGLLPLFEPDERYGISLDEVLLQNFVYESLPRLKRYGENKPGVFDIDNLDNSTDGYSAPQLETPLRATAVFDGDSIRIINPYNYYDEYGAIFGIAGAMRIPYISPNGEHGFYLPDEDLAFDIHQYMVNFVSDFFLWRGSRIYENPCWHNNSCPWLPQPPE